MVRLKIVLGRTQILASKFGIFGGFGWVSSSVLVDEPGFGRVRSSVFSRFGPVFSLFLANRFKV